MIYDSISECFYTCTAALAIACAIIFAVHMDGPQRSFSVTRGISFYLQVRVDDVR